MPMQTAPLTLDHLASSVLAVPPLARHPDYRIHAAEQSRIVRFLESGGVRILLYGGNANFYHVGLHEYPHLLDILVETAGADSWVIPSAGPAYGTLLDQAKILRRYPFPAVMVLPLTFPATPAGVEIGVRRFVEALGKPAILYLKQESYLSAKGVERLVGDGVVLAVKYAVVRDSPSRDPFLAELVERVDPRRVISGIGEQPAVVHLREFGLGSFTSGCVCIAPTRSMQLLQALREGEWERAEEIRRKFQPLEELRNRYGPIPVLHQAVSLCGIAETGPLLPLLTNLDQELWPVVEEAARALGDYEEAVLHQGE